MTRNEAREAIVRTLDSLGGGGHLRETVRQGLTLGRPLERWSAGDRETWPPTVGQQ